MSAAVTLIDVGHVSKQQAASAQVASSPTNNEYTAQQSSSLAPSAPSSASSGAALIKSGAPSIVSLPDPSTSDERDYLVIPANNTSAGSAENTATTGGAHAVNIYEVQGCTGPSKYGSYFVGSRVISDGTLRVATRVDPLFFVLAAIEAKMQQAANKKTGDSDPKSKTGPRWQPLDQLLVDVAPTVLDALRNASTNATLSSDEVVDKQMRNLFHMTDQYGDDMILYKFDEKIALSWLKAKHARALAAAKAGILRASLRDEVQKSETAKLGGGGGAFSSAFNMDDDEEEEEKKEDEATAVTVTQSPTCSQGTATSSPTSSAGDVVMLSKEDEAKARAAALQLVCEYLSDGWRNKLVKKLAMTEEDLLGPTRRGQKRKAAPAASEYDDDHINLDAEEDMTKPPSKWDSGNDAVDKLQQIARGVDGCGGAAGSTTAIMMDDEEREKAKKKEEKMNAKSVGLKRLAKVNTKGMKSLTSFFGGGAKKKKKVQ